MTAATAGAPRVALWLFDCDRHADHLLHLDQMAKVLTAGERARAARLTGDLTRQRWVCARVALRRALGAWAGVAFERRAFEITAQGRPYLAAPAPHFSLSHTGAYALAAISDSAAIGADIEQISPRKIAPERRQRLEAFAGQLCASPLPDESDARFIQAWCRIEAVAKAEGCGAGRLLTRAGLMGAGATMAPVAEPPGLRGAGASATLLQAFDLDLGDSAPGFAAAIAGPAPPAGAAWPDAPRAVDGAAALLAYD